MIKITDKDINYSEKVLLQKNESFDDERKDFIKDLSTLDLQAVPGSGKTTALLAKLIILEKNMPFNDESGILVISHTNAAVDEIKSRIGKFAPKLFQYPNFVGTIQSFVNHFLAIPYYQNKYGKKPYSIDDEIYNEKVLKIIKQKKYKKLASYLDRRGGCEQIKDYRWNKEHQLIPEINKSPEKFPLKNSNCTSYKSILEIRDLMEKEGILCYDDAYILAECFIEEFPFIIKLLQIRFKYVFVDEMQDMDLHQYTILEKIFYRDPYITNYQRIGDINQSIFNSTSSTNEQIWKPRKNLKNICGSHRLNYYTAKLTENIGYNFCRIESKQESANNQIKPKMIIYDNDNILKVLECYANIIKGLEESKKIEKNINNSYIAIGCRKEHYTDDKIAIKDYFQEYSSINVQYNKEELVLKDYFYTLSINNLTYNNIRKQILNAIIFILRLENVKTERNSYYTNKQFLSYIKKIDFKQYEILNLNLFNWCNLILLGKNNIAFEDFKQNIINILIIFSQKINSSKSFIFGESKIIKFNNNVNIYTKNNINIKIGTIHSVKGQTHTSTLYLETYNNNGNGNYESERLRYQLTGEHILESIKKRKINNGKILRQTSRVAYVGFSRATHLFCIAIHKDRFSDFKDDIDNNFWDIITL